MLNYIPDDQYTERGYIAAFPRIHAELRFQFRPFTRSACSRLREKVRLLGEEAADQAVSEAVAGSLVSWSLVDAQGAAIPVSKDAILKLKPELWFRLVHIVQGVAAPDEDPQAPKGDGLAAGERLEADQKN